VKPVYLVRHCKTTGQEPEAPLAPEGREQALVLADFLAPLGVERIVSSPFVRARDSIVPLAERLGLPLETDERLRERLFSLVGLPDWLERYRASFDDLDTALPGAESGTQAMARGVAAVEDAIRQDRVTVLVSHGNLLTLIRRHFDGRSGFEEWQALSNPDVFCLTAEGEVKRVERIWQV
jgi:2,3-bisphosphoglycerate-dependent phosphoglycerate mutase